MNENGLRVLVVDDERAIRRFLRTSLAANGYALYEADNGAEALEAVVRDRPDVIILDLGLPDMDGTEVTARLREWSRIPIIVLSVRDQEADKIAALDAGADDYLTKPFGVGELMARMRVVLRRIAHPESEPVFATRDLVVDLARRQVWGLGHESESHLLRVNISNLRQKIERNSARPEYIITEPGVGYRLRLEI